MVGKREAIQKQASRTLAGLVTTSRLLVGNQLVTASAFIVTNPAKLSYNRTYRYQSGQLPRSQLVRVNECNGTKAAESR
jgi:hypothetical protein